MMMTRTQFGGSRRKCRWSWWRWRKVAVWTWETTSGGPNGWEWEAHQRKRSAQSSTTTRRVTAARAATGQQARTPKSTRAPSSSLGVQRGLSEMPDVATQAHRGPRSQGSDHGSKSQRTGTEKRQDERHLPSRSNSTRKGTHHIVKRPDQAGIRVPPRGPSHLHPTRGNNLNPAKTRSYVEVVRGAAPRSGQPTTATGPTHNTRYILLPRAAPVLSHSSTHSTHCATQLPPRGRAARSYPTTDNTHHNPHPCAPWVAKGTQPAAKARRRG